MASRKLIVEVVGDASSLERTFKRASRATDKFNRDMSQTARVTGTLQSGFGGLARSLPIIGVAVAGFGAVLAKSVSAASDLNEAVTQTDVVFGRSASQIQDWSKTTAANFGIARQQALQTAAGFGALLLPLGVVGDQAAEQSKTLTELGADLASFYNTDVQSALDAIRSGIVGEAEPLRRYGVRLSEVRVQAEAMAESGKKTVASLTDQDKILARIRIILHDANIAAGDFAATSGGLANQQRILTAQIKDAATQVGQALLPVVLDVTEALNEWLAQPENVRKLSGAVEDLVTVMHKLVDVAGDVVEAWRGVIRFFKDAWLEMKRDAIEGVLGIIEPFSHLPRKLGGAWAQDLKKDLQGALRDVQDDAASLAGTLAGISDRGMDIRNKARGGDTTRSGSRRGGAAPPLAGDTARGASAAVRKAVKDITAIPWLQYRLGLAQSTKTLKDDLAVTNQVIKVLTDRLANARSLKERTQLVQAINQYAGEARGLRQQIAQAQNEIRQANRERARQRRENRQFAVLGLGPGGADRVPGATQLRKQLGRIGDAVKGTFLDTGKTRSLLANIRKLLSGSLGRLSEDVRRTIAQMLADIDQQLKEHQDSGPRTKFRIVNPGDVLDGLGLTPEQERAARARLSRVGRGGTIATGTNKTAFGRPIGEPAQPSRGPRRGKGLGPDVGGPITVNLVVDGKTLARVVLPHLQKEGRRRSATARGAGAGKGLALT